MSTKLYVGGIPYTSTESALSDAFSKAGQVVSASIIIDRMTGRSKGFGFVEMADEAAAREAINKLNGSDFLGKTLVVNEAKPKTDYRANNDVLDPVRSASAVRDLD